MTDLYYDKRLLLTGTLPKHDHSLMFFKAASAMANLCNFYFTYEVSFSLKLTLFLLYFLP